MRTEAEKNSELWRLRYRPQATTASTPEARTDSAESALSDGGGAAVDDHGDGEFESEEAGGVVDQAFAFEDVDNALREANAFGDGSGGDGVGSGDDSAEDETEPPVETGEYPCGGSGHAEHRETDQAESKQENADQVEFEIAPGSQPSRGVQKRGEHDEEDDVGIQRDFGNAGNEAEKQAGDNEHDGIRSLQFAREGGKDDDEKKQNQEDDFDCVDSAALHHV
jgi:hypothetical protein